MFVFFIKRATGVHFLLRRGQLKDEYDDIEPFFDVKRSCSQNDRAVSLGGDSHTPQELNASFHSQTVQSLLNVEPAERKFHLEDLSDVLKLPAEVEQFTISKKKPFTNGRKFSICLWDTS